MKASMASASNAASGPMMPCTLSVSTSSCARVLVMAGCPAVSATNSSTLRPASMLLRSLRNKRNPSSICRPPAASAPDLMVRKPTRIGAGSAAATGKASVDASTAAITIQGCSELDVGISSLTKLKFERHDVLRSGNCQQQVSMRVGIISQRDSLIPQFIFRGSP